MTSTIALFQESRNFATRRLAEYEIGQSSVDRILKAQKKKEEDSSSEK